jgi:bacterioferritin (cytochrome b1)
MDAREMIVLLNGDLRNEYKHLLFYLHCGNTLRGLDRLHLGKMLYEHATGEMEHVQQFAHKIRGLGGEPVSGLEANPFTEYPQTAEQMLREALAMEEEVVRNYSDRIVQAEEMDDTGLALFLEDQLEDSQNDIDEIRQLLEHAG